LDEWTKEFRAFVLGSVGSSPRPRIRGHRYELRSIFFFPFSSSFFDIEMANITWKKLRRSELTRAEAACLAALGMLT
jgi:hypothetical protein